MIILGLDCTLDNCAAAISKDGVLIAHKSMPSKNTQAELLPVLIFELLIEANLTAKSIGKIAVTTGPGSFAGVRIGLSFAKSLALSIGAPCIGISSLEVFAAQAARIKTIAVICVAGSVFMASYEGRTIIMPPTRFENFDALKDFNDDWVLCGQGATMAKEAFPILGIIEPIPIDPFILCGLSADRNTISHPPKPLYLRGADVKPWAGYKTIEAQITDN